MFFIEVQHGEDQVCINVDHIMIYMPHRLDRENKTLIHLKEGTKLYIDEPISIVEEKLAGVRAAYLSFPE